MSEKNFGPDSDNEDNEVVFERRLERRLKRIHETDRPWLRRIVGVLVVVASIAIGWRLIVARNIQVAEMYRQSVKEYDQNKQREAMRAGSDPALGPNPTGGEGEAEVAPAELEIEAFLDVPTANIISDCTKAADAFRLLNLSSEMISNGQATLDKVFQPVLNAKAGGVKREVGLLNMRILDASGTEVRLHAVPDGETGKLRTRLFGVGSDGLPDDEAQFSPAIEKFRNQIYTSELETEFLKQAAAPGRMLETETHEVFTYRDRSGVQIIRSNGKIVELQVFARKKFLACTRRAEHSPSADHSPGQRTTVLKVDCKCLDRTL